MNGALPRGQILVGDAARMLRTLPSSSVDCVVTSPPYYMLRNYGVDGQIGLEPHVDGWVEELRTVGRGLARVLKDAGSLWLNLGDSFSRHPRYGATAKGLLAAPERLLLALMADGWICRGKIIWAKPNPMPSSVTDRLNMTYEVIFHLVRGPRYYFALDLIREPHRSRSGRRSSTAPLSPPSWAGPLAGRQDGLHRARSSGLPGHRLGRNPGDVWTIATRGFRGAHFATFPEALVVRPLLATCPRAVCVRCGRPWRPKMEGSVSPTPRSVGPTTIADTESDKSRLVPCGCHAPTTRGVVLDPFFGSGTVGVVAERLSRDWIGIELNPAFADLARDRIRDQRTWREEVDRTTERGAA